MGNTCAIILGAGCSSRMNGVNKQLVRLGGIPVIIRSALNFERCTEISEILVSAREQDIDEISALCREYGISKLKAVTKGGNTRSESAALALREAGECDFIAVHDGARPFADPPLISRVIAKAAETGAAIPAIPVRDTVKIAQNGKVSETPDRSTLFAAQTPQVFRRELYRKMCAMCTSATDDASLAEALGVKVLLAEGSSCNIKITTPDDLIFGESLAQRGAKLRIGHGYDVHRLVPGRRLVLGGVEIPYELGLLGHSDADVLLHAITDAFFGALALGDIGRHFPDTDPQYEGADSSLLLAEAVLLARKQGYVLSNLDATISAEKPKLAPFIPEMRKKIAGVCGVPEDRVSVKATTEEGLGLGGKGIGATCVCILSGI